MCNTQNALLHWHLIPSCIILNAQWDTVFCVWNAGVPDSASVQEVIFWQGRTIQMMYHIIGQAMQDAGVHDKHPRDYLAFYCLGTILLINSASLPVHLCHDNTLSAAEAAHMFGAQRVGSILEERAMGGDVTGGYLEVGGGYFGDGRGLIWSCEGGGERSSIR